MYYIGISPGSAQILRNDPKSARLAKDTPDRRCSAPADGEPRNRRILTGEDPKSAFPGAAVPQLPRSAQIWLAPRTTRDRRVCLRADLRSTLYGRFVQSASDRPTAAGGHLRSTTDGRWRSKMLRGGFSRIVLGGLRPAAAEADGAARAKAISLLLKSQPNNNQPLKPVAHRSPH